LLNIHNKKSFRLTSPFKESIASVHMGGGTFFKVGGHKCTSKDIEHLFYLGWQLCRHKNLNMTSLSTFHMKA